MRSRLRTADDAKRHAATLTLKDAARRIRCPLFVVAGKLDRIVPWEHAQRLAREAAGPVEFLLVEEESHVVNNRNYRPQSTDWMAKQLDA